MPKIPANVLEEIGARCSSPPARRKGSRARHAPHRRRQSGRHDSHGVIQIPTYIERIKVGHIVPGAPWVIVKESPTTTVVDGHWGFGYVVNERAMRLTIEKAEKGNVAAATVFRQGHIGRLSSYTQMAAKAGMIGLITADSGRSPKAVAPFGGREARLGTNPISMAIPSDLDAPPLSRHGDLGGGSRQDRARRRRATSGCRMAGSSQRRQVRPTTRASCAPGRRAVAVGPAPDGGYKGTGLAVMVEILCGLLTGLGFGVEPTGGTMTAALWPASRSMRSARSPRFKKEVGEFHQIPEGNAARPRVRAASFIPARSSTAASRTAAGQETASRGRGFDWDKIKSLAQDYGRRPQLAL